MAIFAIPDATHYCGNYQALTGSATASFRQTYDNLVLGRVFAEGAAGFNEFRDCAIREVERLFFLSISNYRRSFDLVSTSGSPWAHVTMYYSSFFAATALLGMFGAWKMRGNRVIEVAVGAPGSQQLTVRTFTSTYRGSHQQFWDYFYANVSVLSPWIDPSLRFALAPISGTITWPIDHRNDVNYDSHSACALMTGFQTSFRKSRFRTSLPGAMNTQFRLMEALIAITSQFARQLGVRTDALDSMNPNGPRRLKVRRLILQPPGDLGRHARRKMLVI
jgi:hypothetical protein